MLDRSVFVRGMMALSEVFGKEVTEFRADVYYQVLKDLTDDQFRSAVTQIVSTKKYPVLPLPAEILEAAKGDSELLAIQAVEKVDMAMFRFGAYKSVCFDDPVIHRVIGALGGWEEICAMDIKEWSRRKRDFQTMYQAFLRDPNPPHAPVRLLGTYERANILAGQSESVPDVVYIGDKEKALGWTKEAVAKGIQEAGGAADERVRQALGQVCPPERQA